MSIEGQIFYPGNTATPQQIVALAAEYRRAADALLRIGRRGEPLSTAPYRFVAIHAVELYLNAQLRAAGHSPGQVRAMHHDLAPRVALAAIAALGLRKRTLAHLRHLSDSRAYLVARYDPILSPDTPMNRLAATLAEVAEKVTARIDPRPKAPASPDFAVPPPAVPVLMWGSEGG